MATTLRGDAESAARLVAFYLTPDMVAQRAAMLCALPLLDAAFDADSYSDRLIDLTASFAAGQMSRVLPCRQYGP
jgi:hypothetical protein